MRNEKEWSINQANSKISFIAQHSTIANVKGIFKVFGASIYTLSNDFGTAKIDLWIDASSITTGDVDRDEHLKANNNLDTENYDQIRFVTNRIQKINDRNFELHGNLTIKKVTKLIKFRGQLGEISEDSEGNEKVDFSITGSIPRSDWSLDPTTFYNGSSVVVGEDILITCDIKLNCPYLYVPHNPFVPAFNENGVL